MRHYKGVRVECARECPPSSRRRAAAGACERKKEARRALFPFLLSVCIGPLSIPLSAAVESLKHSPVAF